MKLTRFLIADNPMAEGSPSAIIHTIEPVAIIEVIEGHKPQKTFHEFFKFGNELFTFRIHHLFTTQFDGDQHHLIAKKLFEKAWAWYVAYLNWEDGN